MRRAPATLVRDKRGATIVDPRLSETLAAPAEELASELSAGGVEPANFWAHLLPLSTSRASTRDRVSVALAKGVGREAALRMTPAVAGAVERLERSLGRVLPSLAHELELRLPPWRQQWEARGPGLLYGIRRLAEPELLPEVATIVLVHPVAGGGGDAFASYNQVLLEATLTDTQPRLPELVRLGWLLAQANLDLPRYADRLPRDRLQRAAQLGLVPLVLAAAVDAELAAANRATLELALATWELVEEGHAELVEIVDTWWGVYRDSRPAIGAGIVALDAMLPS